MCAGFINKFQLLDRHAGHVLHKGAAQALHTWRVSLAIVQRLFLRAVPAAAILATSGWGAPGRHAPGPGVHTIRPRSRRVAVALRRATSHRTVPTCVWDLACRSEAQDSRWFA